MKARTTAELIEEMAPHVGRFIRYKLSAIPVINEQDVEDIIQDALLGAHTAKTPCDPKRSDGEIRSWFFRVAQTHISRHFANKTCKKRAHRAFPVENQWGLSTKDPTPLEVDMQADRCAEILQEIRRLPQWMRDALLRYMQPEDAPEGVPPRSQRSLIIHARTELRQRLQRRGIIPRSAAVAEAPSSRPDRECSPGSS